MLEFLSVIYGLVAAAGSVWVLYLSGYAYDKLETDRDRYDMNTRITIWCLVLLPLPPLAMTFYWTQNKLGVYAYLVIFITLLLRAISHSRSDSWFNDRRQNRKKTLS